MRTNMKNFIALLLVVAAFVAPAMATPANLTNTTLSSAITAASRTLTLASDTGVTAASGSVINTYLIIDDEVLAVGTEVGGTTWNVTGRGARSTQAASHAASAIVLIAGSSQLFDSMLRGSCTASAQPFWPRIVVSAGMRGTKAVYYQHCTSGVWREANALGDSGTGVATAGALTQCNVEIGSVAYGSVGTSTAMVNGTEYLTSIYVPFTQKWTGIQVLQNATVGTDKAIAIFRDADGNSLVNSATAGTTTSGADSFLSLAFTTATIIPGPAWYNVGIQGGTTATDGLRLIAASTFKGVRATSATGTFGTVTATFTVPTTFTATKAPVVCLY